MDTSKSVLTALALALLISSCGANKEETAAQLQRPQESTKMENRPKASMDWCKGGIGAIDANTECLPEVGTTNSNGMEQSELNSEEQPDKEVRLSYEQAMDEACKAGLQYREDVDLHGMRPSEAENQAKLYSQYLADNSPASRKELYDRIQKGLWMDSCV